MYGSRRPSPKTGSLHGADDERDPDREAEVAGVPVRFVPLMGAAFGSVAVLALALTAPTPSAESTGLRRSGPRASTVESRPC